SGAVPMRTSVLCAEEVPFTSAEAVQTASEELWPAVRAAGLFGIGDAAELQEELDFCTRWGAATQPAREAEAVRSDAPALILAGAFDGSTPPRWARMAAASLSNSTLVEFTGMGHGVLFRPDAQCAMQIVVAFLEDPATVEASCAEAEPDFALPPGSGG
ncbi:MAG TPA: alpha/beta hydrolase, partial [Dehalococcoidia bacterium]|nr:alpha/beta hydrolase [Dehalococcoidia bacterium]